MGEYDFTYVLPNNFRSRVVQFLRQFNNSKVVNAFFNCKYEYVDVGLAYYAGLKGDNWNKKALDFTFEGLSEDVECLRKNEKSLKDSISHSLKSNESGFLVRKIYYLVTDDEDTSYFSSNHERLNAAISSARKVLDDLVQISERICLNSSFNNGSSENSINDYLRDMLSAKDYNEVKDQTRHGISASELGAGEVDILITKEGKEIAIIEALKLNSVNRNYINEHINKAITNYNALGTATFIVAYVTSSNFESFWVNFSDHLKSYSYPLQVIKPYSELPYPNASTRVSTIILTRDGFDFPVYFLAVKIC